MRCAYILMPLFLFSSAYSDPVVSSITLPTITVKDVLKGPFKKDTVTWTSVENKRPRTLVDILEEINGLYVNQSGGVGAASSLFLRGGNSNHTLVMMDGMRILDPTTFSGAFNPGVWVASDFDTLEVSKGPLSSLYGADAVAGVIRTEISKGVKESPQTSLSTLHGSFDTHSVDLMTKGGVGRFHYNVKSSWLKTQGFVAAAPYTRTTYRQHLTNPAQMANFHGRFDVDVNDNTCLSWFPHQQTHRDGYASDTPNPSWVGRSQHQQNVFVINHKKNFTQELIYTQKLLAGFLNIKRHDTNDSPPFGRAHRHKGERRQLTWQHQLAYKEWKILGEAEYQEEALKNYHMDTERHLDLFAKGYTRGLMLAPSYEKKLPYQQAIALKGAVRFDRHSQPKGVKTYMMGAEYKLPTATTLSIHYGTSYKAPSLYQLHIKTPFFKGNSLLKPERSHGVQYGISQSFLRHVTAGIYYFQNRIKHLIDNKNIGGVWTYDNLNRAKISGFESEILVTYLPWKVRLAHTNLYTRNMENGKGLLRRPKNIWHGSVAYVSDLLDAGISLHYKGKGLDVDPLRFTTVTGKSAKSLDAYLTYHVTSHVDLFVKAENILDGCGQQDPLGYLRPGLGVYGGMKVTF